MKLAKTLIAALFFVLATPMLCDSRAYGQEVTNATFTSAISDGGPVDYRQQFTNDTPEVYFYAELLGLAGQTVTHRWIHEGKVEAAVEFKVKKAREVTWSKHRMNPDQTGVWMVRVLDAKGNVLSENSFDYIPAM